MADKFDDSLFEDVKFEAQAEMDDSLFEDVKFEAQAEMDDSLEPLDLAVSESEGPGQLESVLRGTAKGISLSHSDELSGIGDAVFGEDTPLVERFGPMGLLRATTKLGGDLYDVATTDKTLGDLATDLKDTYIKGRDATRAKEAAAQEANPLTFAGGELGGGIASALIPGLGAARLAKGASIGSKAIAGAKTGTKLGALLGSKAITGAKTGAKLGGLYGAGASEADLTKGEIGDFALDTALTAAGGGLLAGAIPGFTSSLGKPSGLLDGIKRAGVAAGTGAIAGVGVDLGAGGETDILDSAIKGAGAGLGAKAALGTGRGAGSLAKSIFPTFHKDQLGSFKIGLEKGKSISDPVYLKEVESSIMTKAKSFSNKVSRKMKELNDYFTSNKKAILGKVDDSTAANKAAIKETEKALSTHINKLEDVATAIDDDLTNTFKNVAEQVTDVKFKPAEVVTDFLKKLSNRDETLLYGLPDKFKKIVRETLSTDSVTGQISLDEANLLRSRVKDLIKMIPEDNKAARKGFYNLYSEINDNLAKTLNDTGLKSVAEALKTANTRYSKYIDFAETANLNLAKNAQMGDKIKARNARTALIKGLSKDTSERSRFEMLDLAKEVDGPKTNLAGSLEETLDTAKQLEDLKGFKAPKLDPTELNRQAFDTLPPEVQALEPAARKVNKLLGNVDKNYLTGELVEDSSRAMTAKVADIIEGSTETAGRASTANRMNELIDATSDLIGKEAAEGMKKGMIPDAEVLDILRKAQGEASTTGTFSIYGAVRDLVGGVGLMVSKTSNFAGRLVHKTNKGITELINNDVMLHNLEKVAGMKGKPNLAKALSNAAKKDHAGRAAVLYTIMQRPDLKEDLRALSDEEE